MKAEIEKSNVRFLCIEYKHPKLSNVLNIILNEKCFYKDNEILSPCFLSRYLAYNYGTHMFFEDMNYTLTIIDSNLNFLTINKDSSIKLLIDDYEIIDRRN